MKKESVVSYYPTTAISDGQSGNGFAAGAIHPIRSDLTLVGRAVTVQLPIGENGAVLQAIKLAKGGDVLVINAKGDRHRAVAGDFVISMMQKVGIAGLVVDGVIRDIEAVRALKFPVFCKGTSAVAGVKNGGGKVNIPIALGEAVVHPGDYIFGDVDGIMVVPANDIDEVLEKTKRKMASDKAREETVLATKKAVLAYLDKELKK
ncbi:MAG: RraA family protein [Kurthia sp.]|nr:RraA family protein [Candidatus Kurthia equi]